jgi:hypothetical protein
LRYYQGVVFVDAVFITRSQIKLAGIAAGTDKVTHHAYERFYADFFAGFDGIGSIVEIGYGNGDSISFWKSLYPSAFLYVIDRDVELQGDGYKVFKCDQSQNPQLNELRDFLREKDIAIILDDGSHVPEHQLKTFNCLFSILRQGGVYVIEDTECSYWRYGNIYGYKTAYGLRSGRSLVNKMRLLPHWINREFLASRERLRLTRSLGGQGFSLTALNCISSISFAHNCVAVFKSFSGDEQYASREYRCSGHVQPTLSAIIKTFIPRFLVDLMKKGLRYLRR